MKKLVFTGRISNSALKKAEQLKKQLGMNNGQLLEYLLQHHSCDNNTTEVLGVGDKVPKELQASYRLTELRDGTLYYAYPGHLMLARQLKGRLVIADVFQASVWQVALEHLRFYEAPYRTLQSVEFAQRDPANFEGWSRERRLAEGMPLVGLLSQPSL